MTREWVIADTHFGHANIIKYTSRPFTTEEEMNETLIRNWNSVVKKKDHVFMLGDFALCGKEKTIKIISQLNGIKQLVMGNHDRHKSAKYWMEVGFDHVSRYPIIVDGFFILSHEPVFLNDSMPYANVFGHVHNDAMHLDFTKQSFCASVERRLMNYTPIDFKIIKETIKEYNKI